MALVDVGAGTSDISITKDGTITAYGMIPVAGDSLTEILVQHCLVDFDTAERIKRQTGTQESVEYQDIMGLTQMITQKEVESILADHVRSMAEQVAACIRELNGDKSVSAVFVVGGGGMVPGYTEQLAKALDIVKERVAIRGKEVMQGVEFEMDNPRRDSMMVTPVGICLSYYEQNNNFIYVDFNGRHIKLYDNGRLSVADAAVQSEFSNEDLFPKRGMPLTFVVNGKSRIVRGDLGETAVIRLNGKNADMYTQVHNGDRVQVTPSTAGDPAVMEIGRLPELSEQLHVYVNGTRIDVPKTATVNGRLENEYYLIREGDNIHVQNCCSVREIAEFMDVPLVGRLLVNDAPAKPETKFYENFTISCDVNAVVSYEDLEDETEEDARKRREAKEAEAAREAKEEAMRLAESLSAGMEGVAVGSDGLLVREQSEGGSGAKALQGTGPAAAGSTEVTVLVNRYPVMMRGKNSYVFVDVFSFINFDLNAGGGRSIVTNLNGRRAEYMEPLKEGDAIEIYWEEVGGKKQ